MHSILGESDEKGLLSSVWGFASFRNSRLLYSVNTYSMRGFSVMARVDGYESDSVSLSTIPRSQISDLGFDLSSTPSFSVCIPVKKK